MGLHYLSKWGKKVDKQYKTKDEALNDSNLHINDVITLNGKNTTKGRLLLANKLPEKFQTEDILHNPDFSLKKKWLYKTLEAIAHHDQKEYPETVNYLKDIGNKYAFEHGLTFSLKDLHPLPEQRDAVLKPFHAEAANINKNTSLSPEQKEAKIVETYTRATEEMDKQLHPMFKKMNNNIYLSAIEVGGKGSAASVRQMLEAPMLLRDANNRIVPNPVTLSYAEGLDVSGYWTALHGARKGTLQKVEGTQEPGKLTKEIVNLNINTLVSEPDCKTTKGIHLSSKEPDVIERYTAKDVQVGTTHLPAGTHITPEIVGMLNKHGVEHVEVRSPMTCHSGNGICQKCIGHSSDGRPHEIGTNIGVIASQAIGEPAIQLALDSFHCQHAQSLVQVKIKDSELTIPMESLWDMFGVPIHIENNMEVKNLQEQEVFIWDEQWVTLNNISRHKPDSPMISVSNKELMVISQDTHPIATWGNKVKCIGCDYHRLKEPSPASKSKKPYCPKCGKYQDRIEQKMSDQLIYKEIKEIEINREYIKHSIKIPENSSNLELNPIIVGFFLAEGCIIYSGDTPNRITLSQNDGEIKDYIYNLLPVEWNAKKTAKTLIINNTKLATYFASLFPRYARNKALPPVFLSYSNEWLADFLSGLIMGDGTVKHFVDGPSQFNIDTTSFSLVQQVAFICYKLGIRCNIVTTPQRKLTRHQGYKISLRMTEHAKSLLANCLKTKNLSQSISPERQIDLEGFRLLSNKKEVLYTHEYVYDVCTSTGSFYASGIKVHNSGGVAASRGGASVDRIKRLGQLLNIPKELPGAAILAEKAGKVTSIEKDPATNGHYIHIGDHKHYAQASKELAVKVGDEVGKGDILTHGPINPHHLLPLKGIEAVRKYVADELADVVSKEGVRKRNIEVITKNLTGLAQVRDAGNSHWLVGDTVPAVELEKHNKQVQNPDNKVIYKHIVKGATGAAPFKSEDFLDQINFNRIQQHLLTAAHTLGGTRLHGLSPIPNIAQSTISSNNKPNY
jgi:hypothetical protein